MGKKGKKSRRPKGALAGIIISTFAENPFRAYNYKQIARRLGLRDQASKDLVYNILQELHLAGELSEVKPGKYVLNPESVLNFELVLTVKNIFLGLFVSALIGLISGFIPAWSASRLNPVDAIRSSF